MDRPITRRDILHGAMVGAVSTVVGGSVARADDLHGVSQDQPGYYPPRLTGLRGSHPGSFEVAHELRDKTFWKSAEPRPPADESYDLCIVGGGISGLSAAYFYRQRHPDARILILDNHDDFGGHAKRNEFVLGGQMRLMNGGTMSIDSATPYSAVADGLIRALGIDPPALSRASSDKGFYASRGLTKGVFFDRETFGADKLVVGLGIRPMAELLRDAPLTDRARRDLKRIFEGTGESAAATMPGLSDDAIKDKLSRMSYADYLRGVIGADAAALAVMQQLTHGEWGVGIDAVPALDAWGFGYPGFDELKLKPGRAPRMGYTGGGYADGGSYTFRFPDGNASIARLLVRALVPAAIAGGSAADIVAAPTDYAQLDKPANPIRLRLSSIVTLVRNQGTPAQPTGVDIVYSRFGRLRQVQAKDCILACWNSVIPFICPELPGAQKEALGYLVKTPLIYASVALRSWRAFEKLGVSSAYFPAMYFANASLNPATNIGAYRSVAGVDEPTLLHMVRAPCAPGLSQRDQNRAGQADVLGTSFEEFERNIRGQLARTLSPGGFDPASDVTAITVNRWPHGYAYEYNSLFDPDWQPGQAPHEIGRKRSGRIAIANSDSGAGAYTDVAIDQAYRAVEELAAR